MATPQESQWWLPSWFMKPFRYIAHQIRPPNPNKPDAPSPNQLRVLLIGETGSGKTSFLNLFCNYGYVKKLGYDDAFEKFHDFNEIRLENAQSKKMESKTSDAKIYEVTTEEGFDFHLEVIDTPGFGDSRGVEEDKKHVKRIIAVLKQVDYINCICLIINGRSCRMTATLKYVLSEITAILPKSVINNVVVVFTNSTSLLHLNFDFDELESFFGKKLEHSIVIDNPYCLLEKANKQMKKMSQKAIAESVQQEFSRAAEQLERLISLIAGFDVVHTNDFIRLYEKKEAVDITVTTSLNEYSNQLQLERKLDKAKCELEAAISSKEFHKEFEYRRQYIERVTEKTTLHNTLCVFPHCTSNCHLECTLTRILDPNEFKNCLCMQGGDGEHCTKCGHLYDYHRHLYIKYVDKVKNVLDVDDSKKGKYLEAKSNEERAQKDKKNLEIQREKVIAHKKKIFKELLEAINDYQSLGVNRSFMKVLNNQLMIIEEHLKGSVTGESTGSPEQFQEMKDELTKKIAVVRDAVNEQ